jgi:hypothetical protein
VAHGCGHLGRVGFRVLVEQPVLDVLPAVEDPFAANLEVLRALIHMPPIPHGIRLDVTHLGQFICRNEVEGLHLFTPG